MKCPNCGSNLTIDDEKCSFCGDANPFAVKHRKEMRRFTKEFNQTKQEVMQKSARVNYWSAKIALIAVMVALNLIMIFIINHSYDVQYMLREKEIEADYFLHKVQLEKFEKERDYMGFYSYWLNNDMNISSTMDEYRPIANMCNSYCTVYKYTMDIVTYGETDYFKYEEIVERVANEADYIYEWRVQDEYDNPECFKEEHEACMDDLIEDMENLLMTYYGITEEEMETFPELSGARKQILLEEGVKQYE